jgi:hypothetical protein
MPTQPIAPRSPVAGHERDEGRERDELLSTTQAAALVGCHPSHLLLLMREGKWPREDRRTGVQRAHRFWYRSTCERAVRARRALRGDD